MIKTPLTTTELEKQLEQQLDVAMKQIDELRTILKKLHNNSKQNSKIATNALNIARRNKREINSITSQLPR